MSKTLADLQTGVRIYLDESQQTDFLDSEVTLAINRAYHRVVEKVIEVYEDYYNLVTPLNYSTVANQQEYTISANLVKIRRVEVNMVPNTSGSVANRAIPVRLDELPLNLSNNSNTPNGVFSVGYYINGSQATQKIGFVPIPTQTGTNNIQVWGVDLPGDLVATGDSVNIPYTDNFVQLIELGAAARLLRKGQEEEAFAKEYAAEFEMGLTQMQNFLKERQAEGVQMIQDVEFEDIQFDNPL